MPFTSAIASSRFSRRSPSSFPLVSLFIIALRFSFVAFKNCSAISGTSDTSDMRCPTSNVGHRMSDVCMSNICTRERSVGRSPPKDGMMRKRYVPAGGSSNTLRSAFCASWYAREAAMMTTLYSLTNALPAASSETCLASSTESNPYRRTTMSGLFFAFIPNPFSTHACAKVIPSSTSASMANA